MQSSQWELLDETIVEVYKLCSLSCVYAILITTFKCQTVACSLHSVYSNEIMDRQSSSTIPYIPTKSRWQYTGLTDHMSSCYTTEQCSLANLTH